MDTLSELLDKLIKMDDALNKQDINTTLRYLHESIALIKSKELP